ncbi:hypothetical protein WICPIJ_001266 [Wickerhamomyces pijperi]|uniref:Uncharacterized protein n=1 Tax=Wickerhamomyces pijperi TaxID=599730 RepID=A0A9P8TQS7_WICPI|nr:hypothetical protein WICPIJ_001266 [Wickerhamomyces pijperi]
MHPEQVVVLLRGCVLFVFVRGDDNGVSLSSSDGQDVDWIQWLDERPVGLNDSHWVLINGEVDLGEEGNVDDSQTVSSVWGENESVMLGVVGIERGAFVILCGLVFVVFGLAFLRRDIWHTESVGTLDQPIVWGWLVVLIARPQVFGKVSVTSLVVVIPHQNDQVFIVAVLHQIIFSGVMEHHWPNDPISSLCTVM